MEAFLVRVWVPAETGPDEADALRLRGFITHVRSGRQSRFSGAEQLAARIVEQLCERLAERAARELPERDPGPQPRHRPERRHAEER